MIPIDTPPGTEIICIADTNECPLPGHAWLPDPKIGELCTVVCVEADPYLSGGFGVEIVGYRAVFSTKYFRLLEKPAELYSLLERVPVNLETV